MGLSRRQFSLGLAASGWATPWRALGQSPRLAVVGAGVGGLGFVRRLQELLPDDALAVTIIEPRPNYCPPFGTARVLAGHADIPAWRRRFPELPAARWLQTAVVGLDISSRRLQLADGDALEYDFLLVAPGLVPRSEIAGASHLGWFNDASFETLLQRLDQLPANGQIVTCVPQLPYRCPPAPYERAGLMLQYLHDKGRDDLQLTVLDAKSRFPQQAQFLSHWERRWPGRISWLPPEIHEGIKAIHTDRVSTGFDTFHADLVHAIPPQRAPAWCQAAGLADFTGYCRVEMPGFRSRKSDRIYVVGDAASAGDMPKSASAALVQARAAAADLARRLGASATSPRLTSHCYSRLGHALAIRSASEFSGGGMRQRETLSVYPLDQASARSEHAAAEAWYQQMLTTLGLKS